MIDLCLCPEGVLSDSEEDKGTEAVAQQHNSSSVWSSKPKEAGYSSEASSEQGERGRKTKQHIQ